MQDFLQENSLWQFAVNFYQAPENQKTLLTLQDEYGFSVNNLLFLLYLDSQKIEIDSQAWQAIEQQTQPLQQSIIFFRQQRFRIKQQQPALYPQAKQQELGLEQLQLAILYQHSLGLKESSADTKPAFSVLADACDSNGKSAKLLQKLQQQVG